MNLIKRILRKMVLPILYKKYVVNNTSIIQDVAQNLKLRQSKALMFPEKGQFAHMMTYYPEFAMLFFWRIHKTDHRWRGLFTKDFNCKLFANTEIAGGLSCFHPFATVINAKSIGQNFLFRNGLTIGNKNEDNSLRPIIGHNVEVGANVVIIGDITIGDNVIIGAGSVVVKDIPSNSIVAGNPAKVIKQKRI